MTVFVATSVGEALDALSASEPPEILAGGTDLMVEVNFGRRRPDAIVSIGRIASLRRWGCPREGAAISDGCSSPGVTARATFFLLTGLQ